MGILDIFGGGKPARESEVDIEKFLSGVSHLDEDEARTWIELMKLNNAEDVDGTITELEKNNIVIIDISPMLKDRVGIKNAVDKLKNACIEVDGDIGRVSAHQIIVVPEGMRVRKG